MSSAKSSIRFTCFPQTKPPSDFVVPVVDAFRAAEEQISTTRLAKGLTSDRVLEVVRPDLESLGFNIERGKRQADLISRPVFFGENGRPRLRYQIDGYSAGFRAGIEVEAGRAWMGNAIYRDLVQAMVMVDVDTLFLAVPLTYKHRSGGKPVEHKNYAATVAVAETLYGHSRVRMPYDLVVVGY